MHDNELIEAVEHEDHKLGDKEADIANTIGTKILETKETNLGYKTSIVVTILIPYC